MQFCSSSSLVLLKLIAINTEKREKLVTKHNNSSLSFVLSPSFNLTASAARCSFACSSAFRSFFLSIFK